MEVVEEGGGGEEGEEDEGPGEFYGLVVEEGIRVMAEFDPGSNDEDGVVERMGDHGRPD